MRNYLRNLFEKSLLLNYTKQSSVDTFVKTVTINPDCKVFKVANHDDTEDFHAFVLQPKPEMITIPELDDGYFIVRAIKTGEEENIESYFLDISFPEAINDCVYIITNGKLKQVPTHKFGNIIPAVAYEGFHAYELYYPPYIPGHSIKPNADTAIKILKQALRIAKRKNCIAETLGYILRDEGRNKEALEAFSLSIENGPSSEFIQQEVDQLGNIIKH